MTENEAKTKWCPFKREKGSSLYPWESIPEHYGTDGCCIGSACMMWRWHEQYDPNTNKMLPITEGYCGLGGTP